MSSPAPILFIEPSRSFVPRAIRSATMLYFTGLNYSICAR